MWIIMMIVKERESLIIGHLKGMTQDHRSKMALAMA